MSTPTENVLLQHLVAKDFTPEQVFKAVKAYGALKGLKWDWKPYKDGFGSICMQAQVLGQDLYVGEKSWHACNDRGSRVHDANCTSLLDGQVQAEAWLAEYLRPTFETMYGP